MTTLLSIDPGAATGVALFFIGPDCAPVLVNANVFAPDDVASARYMPDIVVIEDPQIYPHSKARPGDILTLAKLVGRYQERFKNCRVRLRPPARVEGFRERRHHGRAPRVGHDAGGDENHQGPPKGDEAQRRGRHRDGEVGLPATVDAGRALSDQRHVDNSELSRAASASRA